MNAKFIGYLVEGGSMDFHGVHTEEKVDRATTFLVSGLENAISLTFSRVRFHKSKRGKMLHI